VRRRVKTTIVIAVVAIVAIAAVGLILVAPSAFSQHATTASTTQQCVQRAYVNGKVYCFSVERPVNNASQALIASSQIMYVVTYPQFNSQCSGNLSSCKPQTLSSGYEPQCDPCVQEAPFMYHDHVLSGLPASGDNGTWAIVVVAYAPSFSNQASFNPITGSQAITAGESAGDFARINPNGPNPYEIHTRTVLVFSVYPAS
jgi:hypothetical protein